MKCRKWRKRINNGSVSAENIEISGVVKWHQRQKAVKSNIEK
jgi:hypothetical protein